MRKIIIGTRGSDLALWQANFVAGKLRDCGVEVELKIIKTKGDTIQNVTFDKIEGKGFFTKELEEELLEKTIDLAVHSHKDLPTTHPAGLTIGAVSYREKPGDLMIISKPAADKRMKFGVRKGAAVGTSAARRRSQLLAFRPDLNIVPIRGNVPTRIQKVRDGEFDAIMLAEAGIERLQLDLSDLEVYKIDAKEIIPAPAQGVLALQCRDNDEELLNLLQKINDKEVEDVISLERTVLNRLDGGCQLPLGVYCEKDEEVYKIWASKSETAESMPRQVYLEGQNPVTIIERVLEKITSKSSASVFITKDLHDSDFFLRALVQNGCKLDGKSLIDIRQIPMKSVPKAEWIFFSSKHAVRNFFDQKPEIGNAKIGAVGKATADMVRKYKRRADFIGYSTDTKLTGRQFASTVKNGTVLFPQAKGSLRTIQQQFSNPRQVIDVIVYETLQTHDYVVPNCEVLVFTSPSNVEAFFANNSVRSEQKIVAMGGATGGALKQNGINKFVVPSSFDDLGLVRSVFSLI